MSDTDEQFKVVLNDEEQYSIWPASRPAPQGWREEGTRGPKQTCLDQIETLWTDMRPLSLRQRQQAAAN
ncbi:MbtH family protein [Salinispora fenicalii]|uniref:MbtH family protein n=1 Tax=Salinispora fenicalii TaxID=1137263 RepID=UPI000362DE55|nr:MbtH family NRPS accessory protein [Salinispora fenicalii]